MVKYIFLAFLISFLTCLILIIKKSKAPLIDYPDSRPQAFHIRPVPRIGGLAIFLSIAITFATAYLFEKKVYPHYFYFILLSSPVFLIGLIEDIIRDINPLLRMILIGIFAGLVYIFLNIKISRVDLPYIDELLQIPFISFILTVFALTGISCAINIIDGFNGLASMVSMMIFMSIAYVAYRLGDYKITNFCVISSFALLGFFLLNYPFGLIFLGDGGAYFIGFLIGIASISLVQKHPQVSPWFAFLINLYPIYETLFSFYRRSFIEKRSPIKPDALHLHTLFYKIFIEKYLKVENPELKNSLTSVFIWVINSFTVVPALIFWNNTKMLIIFSIFFMIFYTVIYWKILKTRLIKKSNFVSQT